MPTCDSSHLSIWTHASRTHWCQILLQSLVFLCVLLNARHFECVCVCVNIFIAKGVVTHKCECVCQRVCGEGVINHDLNVDVARYETSCSRHHLRQLLPYTSQPPSHFTYALINRGKCNWINIVRPLMLQIMEHSTLI